MTDLKAIRSDEGEVIDRQQLLERGHLVLHAISTEAHAARMEARKAELQVALSAAQNGETDQLEHWLAAYQASEPMAREPVRDHYIKVNADAEPAVVADSMPAVEQNQTMSWDSLLPHARTRLALQAKSADVDSTATDSSATDSKVNEREAAYLAATEHELDETEPAILEESNVEERFADENCSDNNSNESDVEEDYEEAFPSRVKGSLEFEELPELQVLAGADRELAKPYSLSGKRGLLVSVVVHTAMIFSLMAITMRLPEEVASLGFEASSSDVLSESIEMMQAVDVVAPELMPEMPSESSPASAMSLPSTSALSSGITSSASTASANSSLSSISASASQATSMTGGGKPNLSKVNASFFGAAAGGNSFCYVIDGSESMRGGPWQSAKRELIRSISTLKENQRFYVIFFNKELHALPRAGEKEPSSTALYATPENIDHAREWIESLRISAGAPPDKALERAIELELDAIYFLADGATKRDVPGFLQKANRAGDFISGEQVRVPIHTIAFYSPEVGRKLMQRIASENKGQFIYVPDPRKK